MRSKQSQFLFDIINLTLTSLMGYSFYLVIRLACDRMDIGWDKISLPVAIFAVVLSSTLCVYIKHFWSRKKREYLLCFFEANGYSGMRRDTSFVYMRSTYCNIWIFCFPIVGRNLRLLPYNSKPNLFLYYFLPFIPSFLLCLSCFIKTKILLQSY